MHDFDGRSARRQQPQGIIFQTLDLHPKAAAVRHDEAEITELRNVDARIIDLVDNAKPEREPQARWTETATDHVFGTAGPGRRDAGMADRLALGLEVLIVQAGRAC